MKPRIVFFLAALSAQSAFTANSSIAQVVQLPSVGTFSISTSVAVPDSGSGYAGGVGYGRSGSVSRGPGYGPNASGRSIGGGGVSVHATVIDLEELDQMIRSQSGKTPMEPKLNPTDPRLDARIPTAPRGRIANPEYDYLAVLSGHSEVLEKYDPDAVSYYLVLAERAKRAGSWSSVELYYKLAWNNLPPQRREAALQALAKARTPQSIEPRTESRKPAGAGNATRSSTNR